VNQLRTLNNGLTLFKDYALIVLGTAYVTLNINATIAGGSLCMYGQQPPTTINTQHVAMTDVTQESITSGPATQFSQLINTLFAILANQTPPQYE